MRRPIPLQANVRRAAPWLWALGLSVAAHVGGLFGNAVPAPEAAPRRAPISTRTLIIAPMPAAPPVAATPRITRAPFHRAAKATEMPLAQAATEPAPADIRIAPAAEWLYRLRQNGRQGTARLSWQPQDGRYQLRLVRELEGRPLPGWRSEGSLDAQQGLAPLRYADQRKGRDTQATNFRREEGLISFSASSEQFALEPGVQDRLSWWLQLAARVAGAPQRFGPGSEIRLSVAGLRGEPMQWLFEVVGEETLALPMSGAIASALHLRRAALGPYDGTLDLWLDPSRGHLPVKLLVGRPDEKGWELQLLDDKAEPPQTGGQS